ncbi:MAG: Spindle-shaped haloviruses associated protein [Candidatus Methanohalarchaeum thermophilum]|uniref:Spindle-shaped haloviruses associated protein n=1 Tax=Methanohalarchaeum thermophilum TaxID=1903181 RepID=A0A1Q6DV77_METT1|nr:MAG: Spindle-shaped haloviruses associated protein [Candidatus Methanohalarchaeum thermophilum]
MISIISFPLIQADSGNSVKSVKIDDITTLKDVNYQGNGHYILKISSEFSQPIKIGDPLSGASSNGVHRVPFKKVVLDKGENTVRYEVSVYEGKSMLSIATSRATYNIVRGQDRSMDLIEDYNAKTTAAAGITGCVGSFLILSMIAYVRKSKKPKKPERLL